jgi:hypothetical protein
MIEFDQVRQSQGIWGTESTMENSSTSPGKPPTPFPSVCANSSQSNTVCTLLHAATVFGSQNGPHSGSYWTLLSSFRRVDDYSDGANQDWATCAWIN